MSIEIVPVPKKPRQKKEVLPLFTNKRERISMSLALIRAAQDLSLVEKRIVSKVLSKINPMAVSVEKLSKVRSVVFSVNDYAAQYGLTYEMAAEQLYESVATLYHRAIQFNLLDERGTLNGGRMVVRWTDSVAHIPNKGLFRVVLSLSVLEHLTNLGEAMPYASYQLRQGDKLSSVDSWRLLELLNARLALGKWTFTIEELHHALEVAPSFRKTFPDFQRYVLDKAIKELEKKDYWQITYTKNKAGRNIVSLTFEFSRVETKAQAELFDEVKAEVDNVDGDGLPVAISYNENEFLALVIDSTGTVAFPPPAASDGDNNA